MDPAGNVFDTTVPYALGICDGVHHVNLCRLDVPVGAWRLRWLHSSTHAYAFACTCDSLSSVSSVWGDCFGLACRAGCHQIENGWHVLVSCLTLVFSPILFLFAYCLGAKRQHFRSILITGGGGGLGEALALSFAAQKQPPVTLVLIGRNAERLRDVKDRCNALGATAYDVCVCVLVCCVAIIPRA